MIDLLAHLTYDHPRVKIAGIKDLDALHQAAHDIFPAYPTHFHTHDGQIITDFVAVVHHYAAVGLFEPDVPPAPGAVMV